MKQIYLFLGLITLSLIFSSCKDESSVEDSELNSNSENTTSSEGLGDFVKFDLRPYELNATLLVPKNERATVLHQLDTYAWDLKLGKQTYVSIMDWGTENGFEKYLKKLDNHTETVDFIEKEEDFVVYTLTTGTSKVTYHTAAQHEIDGINYLFESSSNGLSKDGVEDAILTVKSVQS